MRHGSTPRGGEREVERDLLLFTSIGELLRLLMSEGYRLLVNVCRDPSHLSINHFTVCTVH